MTNLKNFLSVISLLVSLFLLPSAPLLAQKKPTLSSAQKSGKERNPSSQSFEKRSDLTILIERTPQVIRPPRPNPLKNAIDEKVLPLEEILSYDDSVLFIPRLEEVVKKKNLALLPDPELLKEDP